MSKQEHIDIRADYAWALRQYGLRSGEKWDYLGWHDWVHNNIVQPNSCYNNIER